MIRHRTRLAAAAAVAAALVLAAGAAAADAPQATVTMRASVSPGRLPIPQGTPLRLTLDMGFSSEPADANLVLQRMALAFGEGASINGARFPSCSAAKLRAARGRLSVCPPGSQIGSGVAVGTAVAIGITSSARLTFFNGPGGRSIVTNVSVVNPALINATLAHPVQRAGGGRYAYRMSVAIPEKLQRVLDGDIVVSRFKLTVGATRTIAGRPVGYLEATGCPPGGSGVHGEFSFNQGASATTDVRLAC